MKYGDLLAKDRPCPFCHPIDGEIAISNEVGYVQPALGPYCEMHALVCPWKCCESMLDFSSEEYSQLMDLVRQMTQKFYEMGAADVVILNRDSREHARNDGAISVSGKSISHHHIHVIGDVSIGPDGPEGVGGPHRSILTPEQMLARVEEYRLL